MFFDDSVVLLRSIIWTLSIVLMFHLMTREEPSLETPWLQNIRKMDKVQIISEVTLVHLIMY
jgi:hypothetical protein